MSSFLLITKYYPVAWLCHNLFIHSCVDGNSNYFWFGDLINEAEKTLHGYIFSCLLGKYVLLEMELLGLMIIT